MMLTKLSPLLIRLSKFLCVIFLFFTPLFIFPPASYSQNFQDDYHSLRPYPFEPLNPDVTGVIQCGNTVYAIGSITGLGVCGPDQCCSRTFTGRYSGIVTIDFANSELPIVGNTEDVANWDVPTDTLSDVEKVNQYVSWYLNGVINRAEYSYLDMSKDCIGETTQKAGVCLNTEPILGLCLSPNPVSPLLPPIPNLLLQADGKNSCGGGKKSCCVTRNPLAREVDILDRDKLINFSGPIRKLLPQRIQDDSREKQVNEVLTERHNQIVACTYGLTIPLTNIQIGAIPGPCYPVASWLNKILELAGIIEPRRLDIWDNHLPPKREEFPEFKEYYKEYRRWRGDTCLSFEIPFLGGIELMLCFDNPAKPNFYGDLYPYIPFTSTEDRGGLAMKEVPTDISGGEKDLVLTNIKYNTNDLNLFYAHMQETVELSDLLKKSYVPKGGTGGEGETTPVEVKEGCQILNIRTNAGDHLVDPDWLFGFTQITGALSFDYKFTCNICGLAGTCTVNPVIPISLSTQNPLHDELWHNLVEGADSVFRRIFPKTGSNTPVTAPKDIPGMTTFETSSNKYTVATGGEIYFPHLGGISEYFLKAIQTALRPKGYGEPFDRGGPISPPTGDTDICKSLANCNPDPSQVDLTGVKDKFIDLATRWLGGAGHPRIDKYDTVIGSAMAMGVDPIFTLAIWLNESGASNYNGACQVFGHGDPSSTNCQRAQDFGINNPSKETQYNPNGSIIVDHFMDQLQIFLGLPNYYYSTCKGSTSAKCPMEIFGAMFKWGQCDPTDNSNAYVAGILGIYEWLKPSQAMPCYPIALP